MKKRLNAVDKVREWYKDHGFYEAANEIEIYDRQEAEDLLVKLKKYDRVAGYDHIFKKGDPAIAAILVIFGDPIFEDD